MELVLPPEQLVEALGIEAEYQAVREALATMRSRRERVLYALWRGTRNPGLIAAHLPVTVTKKTVEAAVVKLAPPQDFEDIPLFDLASL